MAELAVHSSTSDGWLSKSNYFGDFGAAWASDTGAVYDSVDYIRAGLYFHPGLTYEVARAVLYFDTSSIPKGATISAAVISLYGYGDYSDGDVDIVVQNGQPTYPHDPAVTGDYDKDNYSGDGGSMNTADWSLAGYNEITLNSTGRGWVQKGSGAMTKLCLRSSKDIAGTTPTVHEYVEFYASEKGGDYRPKLVITYGATYPSDGLGNPDSEVRVSSIRHIFRPGMFRMQVGLGDLGLDIDIAETAVRKALDTAKEIVEAPPATIIGPAPPDYEAPPSPLAPSKYRCPYCGAYLTSEIEKYEHIAATHPEHPAYRAYEGPTMRAYEGPTEPSPKPELSLWQKITPWKEEKGETFGEALGKLIKRIFG